MAATKGTYLLALRMPASKRIMVGKLGRFVFHKGCYIYVGSALDGLEGRLRRHFKKEKALRWHIDYLRQNAEIADVFWAESTHRLECSWASTLACTNGFVPHIKGFGSSDCRCKTHLFYSEKPLTMGSLEEAVRRSTFLARSGGPISGHHSLCTKACHHTGMCPDSSGLGV